MKLSVICSGGGATVQYAVRVWQQAGRPLDLMMITDRKCQAEDVAAELSLRHERIAEKDATAFSKRAYQMCNDENIGACLLLFSRMVTADLFGKMQVFNIHPSLLPEYPGFKAVERAYSAKHGRLGATLHKVDETMDGGEIVAQLGHPMNHSIGLDDWLRVSFSQKVYLTLLWFEMTLGYCANEVPQLSVELERLFSCFVMSEAIEWQVQQKV
ncbi:hypothetical protein E0Z06_10300 [Rheinheimera sp. D18]|uniref:formyltransferase family protein n=1 Tax=Rheinheimera sp. D18 TaxID=2545632 RepID=UPI00104E1570|nr:formyltransferase family protein [Rheinheimera sp. D18]QBL09887.1 hypothetical protein E0Z06_10300 [Rheinheimera sp. D18]